MTSTTTIPEGMPTLDRGSHSPGTGKACVMEYVSMIAGEPWTDQPKCVHPALAAACRSINDVVEDEARPFLLRLIPRVMGTGGKKMTSRKGSLSLYLMREISSHTMRFMEEGRHSPRVMRDYTHACIQFGKATAQGYGMPEESLCNVISFYACVWARAGKGEQFMNWLLDEFEFHTTEQDEKKAAEKVLSLSGMWTSWFGSEEVTHVALYTADTSEKEPDPAKPPQSLTITATDLVGVGT